MFSIPSNLTTQRLANTQLISRRPLETLLVARDLISGGFSNAERVSVVFNGKKPLEFPAATKRDSNRFAQCIKLISLFIDTLSRGQIVTRRDIFYQDVQLFHRQENVDGLVEAFVTSMGITGDEIGAVAAQKGLMVGDVRLVYPDGTIRSFCCNGVPTLIPRFTNGTAIHLIQEVDYILIVEKEAVMTVLTKSSENRLVITGKGFADVLTRQFVSQITKRYPNIPVLGFADFDPHGFIILNNYRFARGKEDESCPRLQLTNASICDFIRGSSTLDMTPSDFIKCSNALGSWKDLGPSWRQELQRLMIFGKKAELDVMKDERGELVGYIDKMCSKALKRFRFIDATGGYE